MIDVRPAAGPLPSAAEPYASLVADAIVAAEVARCVERERRPRLARAA